MVLTKKALSPIITTILLVVVAMTLAAIILIWARGFTGEKISKFSSSLNEERPIDELCANVILQASISGSNSISIVNNGEVAVYKLKIKTTDVSSGESITEEVVAAFSTGQAGIITTSTPLAGKEVEVAPILIGTSETAENKEYNCKNWAKIA